VQKWGFISPSEAEVLRRQHSRRPCYKVDYLSKRHCSGDFLEFNAYRLTDMAQISLKGRDTQVIKGV